MKPRVAPTSCIVWMVKRRENTFSRTMLPMSTKEMNRSRRIRTPSTRPIFWRFAFRASTREVWYTTSSTSGEADRAFLTTSRLSGDT